MPQRRLVVFLLLLALLTSTTAPAAGRHGPRPKLVLLLVVDQFRADYLERFRADFVPGGFLRLLTRGAVFANTNYNYATTETAAGHATLATGANPASHGVIANEWYDRAKRTKTTSVEDSDYKLLGTNSRAPGASPRKLIGTTLADELRLATGGKARAVGVSFKDRSAILPAGKNPTAVFWLDEERGRVLSSSYYMDSLPAWVAEFNAKYDLSALVGRKWPALGAPAVSEPLAIIQKLAAEAEFSAVDPRSSYFANQEVLDLARRVVQAYKMGRGPATDFLSVSLSANDYLGHFAGPDSPLVRDMSLRTDRMLADFFRFLETEVGPGNFLVAFSSDHGVAPLPEVLRQKHIEAGRLRWQDTSRVMEEALRAAYHSTADEKWVEFTDLPNVYLSPALLEKYKVRREDAARRAGQAALQAPGILTYFAADQLLTGAESNPVALREANSFFPGRSGDVLLVGKPFYHKATTSGHGTNHNSPWSYDTRVPLIFLGPGFRPGVYQTEATPADLAPTLAAILAVNAPAVATGRVLVEALAAPVPASPRGPQR